MTQIELVITFLPIVIWVGLLIGRGGFWRIDQVLEEGVGCGVWGVGGDGGGGGDGGDKQDGEVGRDLLLTSPNLAPSLTSHTPTPHTHTPNLCGNSSSK